MIMGKRLVSLGIELGISINEKGKARYEIFLNDKAIELDKDLYFKWLFVKEQNVVNDLHEEDKGIAYLLEKGLIIEWPDIPTTDFLIKYVLLPRGFSRGIDDNGKYLLKDYPFSAPTEIPEIAYYIWLHAHEFFHLQYTAQLVSKTLNIDESVVQEALLKWVPFLIKKGLLTMKNPITTPK